MKKVPLAAAGRPDGPGPYKTNEIQYILEPRTVPGGAFSMDFHENVHFPLKMLFSREFNMELPFVL